MRLKTGFCIKVLVVVLFALLNLPVFSEILQMDRCGISLFTGTVFAEKSDGIERGLKKVKNPDEEYETVMKKLIRSFFSGTGLKILVAICIFMCLFFFFRVRNYLAAVILYILASILTFFGPYVANTIFK